MFHESFQLLAHCKNVRVLQILELSRTESRRSWPQSWSRGATTLMCMKIEIHQIKHVVSDDITLAE